MEVRCLYDVADGNIKRGWMSRALNPITVFDLRGWRQLLVSCVSWEKCETCGKLVKLELGFESIKSALPVSCLSLLLERSVLLVSLVLLPVLVLPLFF